MALKFTIPDKLKPKNLETLSKGFGLPIAAASTPSIPDLPLGNIPDGVTRFGTYYYDSLFIEMPFYEIYTFDEPTTDFTVTTSPVYYTPDSITTKDGQVFGILIKGAIVDVTQVKNIVKTQIAGMDGSVLEYINQGDYEITIRGFFDTFLPDLAPDQRTRLLNYYCSAPVSLNIVNDFLNNVIKINKIAVQNLNIFQQQGVRNVQYFQISAISDNDFKIIEQSK